MPRPQRSELVGKGSFTPALGVGVVSLAVLALATFQLTRKKWAGSGRWIYAVSATVALYLNVFVAVAQAFLKFPALHALAPTGTEPAFIIAQFLVLGIFVYVGIGVVLRAAIYVVRITRAEWRSGHRRGGSLRA